MNSIDLNCDLGEGVVSDSVELALLDCVTSANIACGGHAGTHESMERLARACVVRNVAVGAHPSYADPTGFGRASLNISLDDLEESVRDQVERMVAIATRCGGNVAHVKPHGALYHDAMRDPSIAAAIADAVRSAAPGARLVGQPSTAGFDFWKARDRSTIAEAFADRRYEANGLLRSRTVAGALLESAAEVATQALSIARDGRVLLADGSSLNVDAQTICLHSDTPGAVEFAQEVRRTLVEGGVGVKRV